MLKNGNLLRLFFVMIFLSACTSPSLSIIKFNGTPGSYRIQLKSSYSMRKSIGTLLYESAKLTESEGYDYFTTPFLHYDQKRKTSYAILFLRKGKSSQGIISAKELQKLLLEHNLTLPNSVPSTYADPLEEIFWTVQMQNQQNRLNSNQ